MQTPEPKNKKILIVDDDPGANRVIGRSLTLNGYQIASAVDGEAALRLLEQEHFDLVILDYMLPGMSGGTVGLYIAEKWPGMPILYISGYGALDLVDDNAHWMPKPFTQDQLLAKVAECLGV